MNENDFHLICPKKLVVFGSKGSGKSTFTEFLSKKEIKENQKINDGKN